MSVWPSNSGFCPSLESSEGELLSVSVSVDPRLLEDLLDGLAQLQFPINPQIYHDAALRYVYADGREEIVPTTLVDFPAYAGRLPEIRRVLQACNLTPDTLQTTGMLDEIHAGAAPEPLAAGDRDPIVFRVKNAHASAMH